MQKKIQKTLTGGDKYMYLLPVIEFLEKCELENTVVTRDILYSFITKRYNIKHPFAVFKRACQLEIITEKSVIKLIKNG